MSESTTLNPAVDAALADSGPADSTPADAAAATTILTPPRIFRYNGQTIIERDQDPGPEFSPQMILDHLKATNIYPELSNAKIEIRQSTLADGTIQIEFVKSGTKGGDADVAVCTGTGEDVSPAVERVKQREVLYLICFLIQAGQKPTIPRVQAILREALGLWSITTDDVVACWPKNMEVSR